MKTPVDWDEIPGVADEIVSLLDDHADETNMEGRFEAGRNGYGENGTLVIKMGNRTFHLHAYEVDE